MNKKKRKISNEITKWLVVIVVVACVVSAAIRYVTLSNRSERNTIELVRQNVEDVSTDISELEDRSILSFVDEFITYYIPSANIDDPDKLSKELYDAYKDEGIEINIVNSDGIIIVSSVPEYIGYDMHSGDQAAEFLVLLDGKTKEYIQDLRGMSYDESIRMKYAGKSYEDGSGFLQVGLTSDRYVAEFRSQASLATTNRRIGKKGYLLVCNNKGTIINSYHNYYTGKTLEEAGIHVEPQKEYYFVDEVSDVFGTRSYININRVRGIYIIGVYPVSESVANVNTMMRTTAILESAIFLILFIALIILLRKLIINNMVKVNDSLSRITAGHLDEKVNVCDTYEFDTLSADINETVDKLKGYIAEATARIDSDLEIAETIQTSVLPNTFPPFPEQKEFELFASMHAAKVVGGDFYDYYMIGRETLGFVIADVSGKSIPGAMFMMTGKAIIKNLAESGMPPADVFCIANAKLREGNDACLFITAWMGYLDINTGVVHAVNAGHNPPVLIRDGKAEFVKLKSGLVLAAMDGMIYQENIIQLEKGDILYLYTDGVTEAINENEEQYGDDRLLELLSFGDNYPEPAGDNGIAGAVCDMVKADLDKFVDGAEQFDDITMLCIKYNGKHIYARRATDEESRQ
ncbi:MAG: serine/threonine-protein phosphatase [Lachnospiraceae bacterium]|nr:serine/threonine-protein phosphatase [Lachnospiraceae bacterium]